MEHQALAQEGLTTTQLSKGPHGHVSGHRRPLREKLSNTDLSGGVDEHGAYVRLAFTLPPGSFATVVLREIMKNDNLTTSE